MLTFPTTLDAALATQGLSDWLTYTQSLTQKLKAIAKDASLQVLQQAWQQSDEWDLQQFGLCAQTVLHREIVMRAWGVPCWYAKTILPRQTYEANQSLFDRLQTEILGELIFNGNMIHRISLEQLMIDKASIVYTRLTDDMHQQQEILWARLSTFALKDNTKFYLLEVLLPGLMRYCD